MAHTMHVMAGILMKNSRKRERAGVSSFSDRRGRKPAYALSISIEISSIARAGSSALRIALPITI